MIIGFCAMDKNDNDKLYDYCGVVYPEGLLDIHKLCLFNHKDITKLYHVGLHNDQEEVNFKKSLEKLIKEGKK